MAVGDEHPSFSALRLEHVHQQNTPQRTCDRVNVCFIEVMRAPKHSTHDFLLETNTKYSHDSFYSEKRIMIQVFFFMLYEKDEKKMSRKHWLSSGWRALAKLKSQEATYEILDISLYEKYNETSGINSNKKRAWQQQIFRIQLLSRILQIFLI